jgi:serine/threonine-protein kinase
MSGDATELERRFAQLVDATRAQRAEALRALQADHPEIAQRLARLLDAHEATHDPFATLERAIRETREALQPEALIGRELGGWRLTRVIGRGGMSIVYAAESERDGVRRAAAVKLLSIPLFDAGAAGHFLQEARALARLDHPGICRLLDWGHSEEGWPYLVLDHVRGVPLDVHVRGLPLRQRLGLLAQVADAVAAAHRELIVHLDLKPANVLVDEQGRPILLDFGISRMLNEDADARTTLSRWLTPRYASPEQLRGESASVATDLYAMGVMLYELATDALPFDLEGASVTESLRRMEGGAPAPTRRTKGLPRDLDAVCARAMHADPARRYASVDAFAEDLRALIERRPVAAQPDRLAYRLGRLFARHPVAAPASVVGIAAVAGLAILLAVQAVDLRKQRDRAEHEATRAEEATEFLLGSIDAVDPKALSGTGIGLAQLLDATERRLEHEPVADARLRAQLYLQTGRIRSATGQNEKALAAFDAGLAALAESDVSESGALRTRLLGQRARSLRSLGQLDEALAAADASLAVAGDQDARLRIWAQRGKAQVLEQLGRFDESAALTRASMALVPADDPALLAALHDDLAALGLTRMDFHLVEENARKALELYRKASGEPTLDQTEAEWRLAAGLLNLGRAAEARPLIEDAVAVRKQLFGAHDHRVGEVLSVRSDVEDVMGERDAALRDALETESIYAATLDPGSPRLMNAYGAAGNQLLQAGRNAEATERYTRGLALARATYGKDPHPVTAFFINALADVAIAAHDYEEAAKRYREVVAMMHALHLDDGVNMMWTRIGLARALRALGRNAEALREAEAGMAIARKQLPEDDWERAFAESQFAYALFEVGRVDEAETHARAAEALLGPDDSPAQADARIDQTRLMRELDRHNGDTAGAAAMQARLDRLQGKDVVATTPSA